MSKIIIHNESDKDDALAVQLVHNVMSRGKESGDNQYCYHTHWSALRLSVIAMRTRGETYTFRVKHEVMHA